MKGSKFLKVMGILCIIFGAISLVSQFLSISSLKLLKDLGFDMGMGTVVVGIISAIIMLVAGILGVTNSKKPEKAMVNVILGVLLVVMAIVGIIMSVKQANAAELLGPYGSSVKGFSVMSLLGLAVPVLYLIPSFMLKSNKVEANDVIEG